VSAAIRTEQLTRAFGARTAVCNLSLEVAQGEIFGLVGPDGAGKTTTMRLLTGILEPTSGAAWVMGRNTRTEAEPMKDDIGYMSQRFGLYPDLTVLENIHFYADIYSVPRKGRGARIEELLGFSNLTPFKHRQAGRLSGGMKQKLGLACALIHTPKVLFLDEPTNGVDPVSRRDFWRILYQLLRQQVTIFVSTAYLDEAERCGRLALMHEGRLLGVGTPADLKQKHLSGVVEIRLEDPRAGLEIVRLHHPDVGAGLFGRTIHLPVAPDAGVVNDVRATLEQNRTAVQQVRAVEPSLEDVFVAVMQHQQGEGDEREG
jgi:ABC-2 type transport system ATP-binding protein